MNNFILNINGQYVILTEEEYYKYLAYGTLPLINIKNN